jgi:hypothetical protein
MHFSCQVFDFICGAFFGEFTAHMQEDGKTWNHKVLQAAGTLFHLERQQERLSVDGRSVTRVPAPMDEDRARW